jgi:hypothetical protein
MLAHAEGQMKADGIYELGLFKIRSLGLTTGQRLCWTILASIRCGADRAPILMEWHILHPEAQPKRTLGDHPETKARLPHCTGWYTTGAQYPNDLADNMRINRNDVAVHRGLKNQPTVIILHDLKICIKQPDQPGKYNAGTIVKISQVVGLDDLVNAV